MHRRKKLIFWRLEQRLRQKDVYEKLGITSAHYSNIERGISDPSYELIRKFRILFKPVDVIDLFEKENWTYGNCDTTRIIGEE